MHRLPRLFVIATLLVATARAATLHVAPPPLGQPGAPGTAASPLASVQAALDRATAGDTIRLRPGIYYERVTFKTGGRHNAPVTLEGEPGAILDGSHTTPLDWQPAPDIAPGVYRAAIAEPVRLVTVNGRTVTMLRDDWVRPGRARHGTNWEYTTLFRDGIAGSGWNGVRALSLYQFKEKQLLLRLHSPAVSPDAPLTGEPGITDTARNIDPRQPGIDITVGPPPNLPIVLIDGTDRCVVRGLTLRNAGAGVLIRNSLGSVVEDCIIGPAEEGIALGAGADRVTLRFNEIFWNPYGENRPKAKDSWDLWTANKRGGWSDKHGIKINGSRGGHRIHDNLIHHHWDGISVSPGDRGTDGGMRIHHNRLFTLVDDGFETNGAQEDNHWNDNIIDGTLCAIRLKAPDHGPFYVYRNILLNNKEDLRNFGRKDNTHSRDPATGEWKTTVVGKGSPVILPAVAYIYHNTGTSSAAIVSNSVYGIGVPNYHFYNNLFWCEVWWRGVPKAKPSIPPNWKGDHNVYLRRGDNPAWTDGEAQAHSLGIDRHGFFTTTPAASPSGFTNPDAGDVSLRADSPARGRGADLTTLFGKPLPGCEPGYFEGTAPDAGALPEGRPMPRLPRLRSEVEAEMEPAGSWPGPDARHVR
ncbi:right-handed parallel beta-helix repeat-containing protein [Geminisphaera colitermitum]|uniref:right-handed parallel beta-helix repeat-containing protein n=1 Tax=Geminisphaera colitermitum TaxID=1148786 RepID=UPI000158C94F|nr:right-handed parallel beta-helix repeat-containing protein [Geminisphaera colitermitum]